MFLSSKKEYLIIILCLLPAITNAQTLVNIPQFTGGGFDGYINAVYAMFISIAALLAVVKIIVAGVKYMFSDVVTQKSEAKKDIQGALLGLLIVLGAVLILTVINPNLTRFNLDGVTTLNRAPANGLQPAPEVVLAPTGTIEPGSRVIPTSLPFEQRARFIIGCGGQVVQTLEEIRCFEIDPAAEATLRADLETLPEETVDTVVRQYEFYLGPRAIEDQTILDAIDAEWSTTGGVPTDLDVIFAVDFRTDSNDTNPENTRTTVDTQARSICNQYREANPQAEIEFVEGDRDQNYGACIRINN